jgi:hypothetical protein
VIWNETAQEVAQICETMDSLSFDETPKLSNKTAIEQAEEAAFSQSPLVA